MRREIVKPETQKQRLEPTGQAKAGKPCGSTGTGPGLVRQEAASRVFGWVWNVTDQCLQSKPGPLAGYPDPLLTLVEYKNGRTGEVNRRGGSGEATEGDWKRIHDLSVGF